jgi:glutamine cyclotransferase
MYRRTYRNAFILVLFAALAGAQNAPVQSYRIVATYPHDPKAFTEGLEFKDGVLYESTGLNGESSLRKVNLTTGAVLQNLPLSTLYFGEGITFFGNRLYQLTYHNGIAFVYDPATLAKRSETFHYGGEGWALTHDAKHVIMDDGSSALRILDPVTFTEVSRLVVREGTRPVDNLNELEYIEGEIWANIWQTNRIVRIDPRSGQVNAWVDLTGLEKTAGCTSTCDVLNGIAYDAPRKRIFVTGKRWPKLFQIEVVPKAAGR